MAENAKQYLNIISQHLQENHAALFVGAGFSLNADKVTSDVPAMPLWNDLATKFREKLGLDGQQLDSLTLAENVEIAYGRHELDQLLLDNIRDADYLPSQLHSDLLRLPWSDVFTTNYDTLLERAAEVLPEKVFTVITNKSDLVGTSGATRIVKLHGSFPSQHPFIITSEDYRTYPVKFAPFVNTVQQSLLENTLCLIGFSGDDPNFNKWVGWIRDNLGEDNAPQMYLLTHQHISDVDRKRFYKRNIIIVELQECFPTAKTPYEIYQKALEYLWKQYLASQDGWRNWKPHPLEIYAEKPTFLMDSDVPIPRLQHYLPIKEVLPVLRKNHKTLPNVLFLSEDRRTQLRSFILSPAEQHLRHYCKKESIDFKNELEYLYEYDWLYSKTLLPLFDSTIKCYQKILERHPDEHSEKKISVLLSLLRAFRIDGNSEKWKKQHNELITCEPYFTQEQRNEFKWECCLYHASQYEFNQLKKDLDEWAVSPNMTLWALRKAGLLAEYSDTNMATVLLQSAIKNLRKRLAHQSIPDRFLLSLESAIMELLDYITQAEHFANSFGEPMPENQEVQKFVNRQHQMLHRQYEVSWEDENMNFIPRLEAEWTSFQTHQKNADFDFGVTSSTTIFGDDKNVINALTFLRFRDETGIPFRIGHTCSDNKAAGGAAERLARYYPDTAILTLVRADAEKTVEKTLTRSLLSTWTQEDADLFCQLYISALERADADFPAADWPKDGTFSKRAANVLPEVLSRLCSKCSDDVMEKLLNLLKNICCSENKKCYPKISSLMKRLLPIYPVTKRDEMLRTLLSFPIKQGKSPFDSPEPFSLLPSTSTEHQHDSPKTPFPEISNWISMLEKSEDTENLLERLIYCNQQSLLTTSQKIELGNYIWNNGNIRLPKHWRPTLCLDLPAQPKEEEFRWLRETLVSQIVSTSDILSHTPEYRGILWSLSRFSLDQVDAFDSTQITTILLSISNQLSSLLKDIDAHAQTSEIDNFSITITYEALHTLWLLLSSQNGWTPTENDKKVIESILNECHNHNIRHCGLEHFCYSVLEWGFSFQKELERSIHSTSKERTYYVYETLAIAICHPEKNLFSKEEIHLGIGIAAQQIMWGAWSGSQQLVHALQFITLAANILDTQELELITTGLAQLLDRSTIGPNDTIESASEKGDIRRNAVRLSRKLSTEKLSEYMKDILLRWQRIGQDKNEFAEIRTAW